MPPWSVTGSWSSRGAPPRPEVRRLLGWPLQWLAGPWPLAVVVPIPWAAGPPPPARGRPNGFGRAPAEPLTA